MSERLKQFMARIATETYPEPITECHTDITKKALDMVLEKMGETPEMVLDVGCGQGPALKLFASNGIPVKGIALNQADVDACLEAGLLAVSKMDQNDMTFKDGQFHLVWARHVIEHSVAPLWTLTEFHRVLRPGGWLYLEVPAPDTPCVHESNQNHYSVFGKRAWLCLLEKAGFSTVQTFNLNLDIALGRDIYFGFIARKV